MKVYLYEFCLSYIIYCRLFYIMTILTQLFLPDFWHLSHRGKEVKEVFSTSILVRIGHVVRWLLEKKVANWWFSEVLNNIAARYMKVDDELMSSIFSGL